MKAASLCLAHVLIIAMARVNGDPTYVTYRHGKGLKKRVEELLKASYPMAGFLKNFVSFKSTFRIRKLLCLVCTLIGSCLVEIPFRARNCASYVIGNLRTIM